MTFGKGLRSAEDTVSIHATLSGGDLPPITTNAPPVMFLPTPPSRVATPTFTPSTRPSTSFYPRHPRGWRQAGNARNLNDVVFLSTPPSRVATRATDPRRAIDIVSIHATLAGSDFPWSLSCVIIAVSIHATLAGGDVGA